MGREKKKGGGEEKKMTGRASVIFYLLSPSRFSRIHARQPF